MDYYHVEAFMKRIKVYEIIRESIPFKYYYSFIVGLDERDLDFLYIQGMNRCFWYLGRFIKDHHEFFFGKEVKNETF
jgi:hypothetical protein